MMRGLIASALRLRVPVVALSIVLIIVGIRTARDAPFDVFPEFAPPLVEIQTEAPGLSTADVEALVSVPLEAAMNGVPGLKTLRSKSVLGLSSVVLIFADGTDRLSARQLVQERLARVAATLPAAAHPPVILSPLSSLSRVLKIGMSSKTLSQVELTTLAKWTVRPRLMSIPGVANVAIWGERDRQIQVLVDPERLRASSVTLQESSQRPATPRRSPPAASRNAQPAPGRRARAGGHVGAASGSDADSAAGPWRGTGTMGPGAIAPIGDVAAVIEGFPPPIGDGVINNGPGLLLIVEKQPDGNSCRSPATSRRHSTRFDLVSRASTSTPRSSGPRHSSKCRSAT